MKVNAAVHVIMIPTTDYKCYLMGFLLNVVKTTSLVCQNCHYIWYKEFYLSLPTSKEKSKLVKDIYNTKTMDTNKMTIYIDWQNWHRLTHYKDKWL